MVLEINSNSKQNFTIYNISEFFFFFFFNNWKTKLFSEEERGSPEHCLKLERWQGPPHINKVKQCEIVLSFNIRSVCLENLGKKIIFTHLSITNNVMKCCSS